MCGIVGVVLICDVILILIEGLKCFEYWGYDFVGIVCFSLGVDIE